MSVDVSHWPSRNSSASRHSPNEVFDNGQLFLERWRGYHLQNHHTCLLCASLLQSNWHLPDSLFTKAGREKVKTNSNPISECFLHVHKEIPVVRCKFFCLSTRVVCFLALFCTSKLRLGEQLLQALYRGCVWPLSEGERHRLLQRSPSQHCLPLSITLQVLFSTADTHKTHTRTQCSTISPELYLVTPQPTRVHVHGAV